MQKVGKFFKVSFEQFENDCKNNLAVLPNNLQEIYDKIQLPKRATMQSAGYDFFSPFEITLPPKTEIVVPTGIRTKMLDGTFLAVFPRSGLGFKFKMQLCNTVGIIDADYFNAENEGHILLKVFNDTNKNQTIVVEQGKGFAQGILLPFGITEDDEVNVMRTGGFGSTTK